MHRHDLLDEKLQRRGWIHLSPIVLPELQGRPAVLDLPEDKGSRKAIPIAPPSQSHGVSRCLRDRVSSRAMKTPNPKDSMLSLVSNPKPAMRPNRSQRLG